jgi:RHS repeat-associated protein
VTDREEVETYSAGGTLQTLSDRGGMTQTLSYDTSARLSAVTDLEGRQLQFSYNNLGHIQNMTDPAGNTYTFTYYTTQTYTHVNLVSVAYPGSTSRTYHYENTEFPNSLTGITDERGVRYATFQYDTQGRAVLSKLAGGVEQVQVNYNIDGTSSVTNAVNATRNYSFATVAGVVKRASGSLPCFGCASETRGYDTNGNLNSYTDFNGNVTVYTFDQARNLETSRTEAYGTALARTITTQWHPTFRLPTQVDRPGLSTTYTYDGAGNRLTETATAATGEVRTMTWTYNNLGQVLTIDGPRTDVTDVTAYTYDSQHNLATITNALGHVTQITEYDLHGNPKKIIDPNGVETTLTYDVRQRLKTRTINQFTTSFDYDGVGQLTQVTLPDNSVLIYTYDAARRLTDIEDGGGNMIHYTLDLLGNRTAEEIRDSSNNLVRKHSQVFNVLGRLHQIKNGLNAVVTEFGYDAQGNRTSQVDYSDAATSFTTTYTPDALNRIKEFEDAASGVTSYGFNALDQLTSVTDPKNVPTSYVIDALGNLKQQVSRDSGTTSYTYDAAGNRTSQTDARDVQALYAFDASNRLTSIDYPGTAEDITYTYDSAAQSYGKGRLTGITDQSGSTTLIYDARGNVTHEQRTIGSTVYETIYTYDAADRVSSVKYPSLRTVTYTRNALGQITKVETTVGNATTTVADNISYMPFGGVKSYTLANGVFVTRNFDLDYRLTGIKDQGASTLRELNLDYDWRGNVEQIDDLLGTADDQTFSYDELSRLVSAAGGYGLQGLAYDAVGNRLSKTVTPIGGSATPDDYAYQTSPLASHRLLSQSSGAAYTYDNAGNVESNGALGITYNMANRPAAISGGSATVANIYGANGQRIKKTAAGVTTVFHYDRAGHLIQEDGSGLLVRREYVWLEDIPLLVASDRKIPDVYVDNTASAFTTVGAWTAASAADQYGSSYAKHGPAADLTLGETVVDDADATTSYSGMWVEGQNSCDLLCPPILSVIVPSEAPYEGTYRRSAGSSPGSDAPPVFTWNVPLGGPGQYQVYVRWVPVGGAGDVTYNVTHASGTQSHPINQAISSNGWYALGRYEFGSSATITLTPNSGVTGVADAVKVVPLEDVTNHIASWAAIGEAGKYQVFALWPSVVGASSAAPFSVVHAGGTAPSLENQAANGGTWNSLGEFTFNASSQGVKVGAVWNSTVLADAIHFVPVEVEAYRTNLAYVHVDHLNTPRKLTDANQAIVWSADYDPFGEATVTQQAFFDNPLRFPGQYFDVETGLHQNWKRDYDPSIGRYLQPDPIGLGDGPNVYAYVGNNPISRWDFNGEAQMRCSPSTYVVLRSAVVTACKWATSCNDTDSCNTLRLKIASKRLCIVAQETITRVCFPDNPTHKGRIEDEKKGIARCQEMLPLACGGGGSCPIPPQ